MIVSFAGSSCEFCVMPLPVSCFIIALNEADRIVRTIRSVRHLVDEVIVVDSGSADGTPEVAAAEGAHVVHQSWLGFGRQKQTGEALCHNDWILNIDADEVVTPELAAEMRELFNNGEPGKAGYGLWIQMVYPGAERPRWWGRDHYCVRLYDRRRMGFSDSALHDSVVVRDQPVGRMANGLHHFSFRTMDHLIAKSEERADCYAHNTKPRAKWKLRVRLVTEMPVNFVKYYIGRGHVTGGLTGFKVALINARYRRVRIARALRHQHGTYDQPVGRVRRPGSADRSSQFVASQ